MTTETNPLADALERAAIAALGPPRGGGAQMSQEQWARLVECVYREGYALVPVATLVRLTNKADALFSDLIAVRHEARNGGRPE